MFEPIEFTKDEVQQIHRAALRVWDEVGYECLIDTPAQTMHRDEVIEVVVRCQTASSGTCARALTLPQRWPAPATLSAW